MNTILVGSDVVCNEEWKADPDGRILLLTLTKGYRVVVGLNHGDVDRFDQWARLEGIRGYDEVLPNIVPAALRGYDTRMAQVENLQGRGFDVVLLVDSSPERIANAMRDGVPGLLYAHPKFQAAEFRPDYVAKITPWQDLVAEINHQHILETDMLDKQPVDVEF